MYMLLRPGQIFCLTSVVLGLAHLAQAQDHVPVSRGFSASATTTSTVTKPSHPKSKLVRALSDLSLDLEVGVVIDPDFPPLDSDLINRALKSAAKSFQDRFGVTAPNFVVTSTLSVEEFIRSAPLTTSKRCKDLLAVRYRGGGPKEFEPHRARAIKFLKRWPLKSLSVFVDSEDSEAQKTYPALYEYLVQTYTRTVEKLRASRTSTGTALVDPAKSNRRSFAAWNCALSEQSKFDVVITNTFIMADLMTEPHPHAFLGKAKIGGIAGPNQSRTALGRSALLATTFGIDTHIEWLSELSGTPATEVERASILGDYLLAHEIAHAVFGIPDMFDHPPECLMTSRPNETYRQGLKLLTDNVGTCPKCRNWVKARSYLDKARNALQKRRPKTALRFLARASSRTPKHFHGGYKKRMSQISYLVSRSYQLLKRNKRAKRFAKRALDLDPKSFEAKNQWAVLTSTIARP
jgi:hypothetical protein